MKLEIEAKMRLQDVAGLVARLTAIGARPVNEITQTATYLDTPDGSLKSTDQGLRVRTDTHADGSNEPVTITHKGPRAHGKLKSRSETELPVADARAALDLLGALGYVTTLTFEKRRKTWELDGCSVEIDTLPYLGDFIEIEGPSDDSVMDVRKRLGLDQVPLIRPSYISMLSTHLSENGITNDTITFDEAQQK